MKILLDSYSTVAQNKSGGLQVRIFQHYKKLQEKGVDCKLFDKWSDKIEDFDIFHLFKVTKDSYNDIVFAKQKGKKVVVSSVLPIHFHNKIRISLLLSAFFKLNLPYQFIKKILELADVIVAQTYRECDFINRVFGIRRDKMIVIPNAVSSNICNKLSNISFSEKYKISKPFVLQVGRFDKNKNQLNVIRALNGINIPVVFIGGEYLNEPDYYRKCKDELSSSMLMTGWIDHGSELLLSAYKEAKVVVMPSYFETFGNVIVEAGVSGANIACSNTLPINDFTQVSKFWTTFNPYNLESIKKAIIEEYEKPNNILMRDAFITTFSWDSVVEEYIKVYKSLLI